MIKTITLQNYRSFGERQTVPLEPLTVLVGPNNSGKSSFMSVPEFVKACAALENFDEGDPRRATTMHRPGWGDSKLEVEWTCTPSGHLRLGARRQGPHLSTTLDRMEHPGLQELVANNAGQLDVPSHLLRAVLPHARQRTKEAAQAWDDLVAPMLGARLVKLSLDALRADAPVVDHPELTADGRGVAAVLGLWRGADFERAQHLDDFLKRCIPELQNVVVRPSPTAKGAQRLWVRQKDGEEFEPSQLSDGLLYFIGLAAHVISLAPGGILLIEEPEVSIHPRRLRDLVDLLRTALVQQKCQIILSTHSPVLLREFRDEPEAILLFRRGPNGSTVRRLADVPTLMDSLQENPDPGLMLEDGFFNEQL